MHQLLLNAGNERQYRPKSYLYSWNGGKIIKTYLPGTKSLAAINS
jgi:hypothetical protein